MAQSTPEKPRMHFSWLTDPYSRLRLTIVGREDVTVEHDPVEHEQIDADPRRFCGDLAVITRHEAQPQAVGLEWAAVPYCRRRDDRYRTIGWNFLLTVDDGHSVVVAFRDAALTSGGRWHVSANESAEPGDLAEVREGGQLPVGQITSRALREELGLAATPDQLDAATYPFALFQVGENLGVYFHVRGEMFGWTGADVLAAHEHARDGWEGAPQVVPLSREAFTQLAPEHGWTEWSLPGLRALHENLL